MSSHSDDPKVVDLAKFREKKSVTEELARGRNPLFVSHLDGKVKGSPHLERPKAEDFGDRVQRIRSSLEKINRLMSELKKISQQEKNPVKEKVSNIVSIH